MPYSAENPVCAWSAADAQRDYLAACRVRRERLYAAMAADSLCIVAAVSGKVDADVYYLTGFAEPSAWFLCTPGEAILVGEAVTPQRIVWEGPLTSPGEYADQYGVDSGYALDDLPDLLHRLLAVHHTVYYDWGSDLVADELLRQALQSVRNSRKINLGLPRSYRSVRTLLHAWRTVKDAAECQYMKRAIDVTVQAHRSIMRGVSGYEWEYQASGWLAYQFAEAGGYTPAYPTIAGSGRNACYLHYMRCQDRLQPGQLLLVDGGCTVGGYAADITRTFPVSGRFSEAQRDLYACVLAAQLAGIAAIRPGQAWTAIQEAILQVLVPGLLDLGILEGSVESVLSTESYKQVYMHSSGHWLGLQVHDTGAYQDDAGASRLLEPGMVLTVEPGVYIPPEHPMGAPWAGTGIRIEDNVLVTPEGCVVWSADLPKTPESIEAEIALAMEAPYTVGAKLP